MKNAIKKKKNNNSNNNNKSNPLTTTTTTNIYAQQRPPTFFNPNNYKNKNQKCGQPVITSFVRCLHVNIARTNKMGSFSSPQFCLDKLEKIERQLLLKVGKGRRRMGAEEEGLLWSLATKSSWMASFATPFVPMATVLSYYYYLSLYGNNPSEGQKIVLCESLPNNQESIQQEKGFVVETEQRQETKKKKNQEQKLSVIGKITEAIGSTLRIFQLIIIFTPPLVLSLTSYVFPSLRDLFYRSLLFSFELSGPAFIKLGQWASTRPDIFPPEICSYFEKLHDSVRPHGFRYSRKTIEEAFKIPFDELFEEFFLLPLGSGCVAQVSKTKQKKANKAN